MKRIIALLFVLTALPTMAGIPYLLVGSDTGLSNSFTVLNSTASNIVTASRATFTGGDFIGQTFYRPDGLGHYDAFVPRDAINAMRATPWLFSNAEVSNAVIYTAWLCYTNVDSVRCIGAAINHDGTIDDPPQQDHKFDWIDIIYEHYRRTGSLALWNIYKVPASNYFASVMVSNHVVFVGDSLYHPDDNSQPMWGFQDSGTIAGFELATTLFRYRACKEMDILNRAAGTPTTFYTNEMALIATAVVSRLYDSGQQLFKAGTLNATDNTPITNHSVFLSAYAVVLGCGTSNVLDAIAWKLSSMVNSGNHTIQDGSAKHFPVGEEVSWNVLFGGAPNNWPRGFYQNGGHWASFSGWVALGIKRVNKSQADAMIQQLTGRYTVMSSSAVANEAEHDIFDYTVGDNGQSAPQYLDSVCMPFIYWSTSAYTR